MPVKSFTKSKINQETTTKMMPSMAYVMVLRAEDTCFWSPPEVINLKPPKSSITKKAIAADGARNPIMF